MTPEERARALFTVLYETLDENLNETEETIAAILAHDAEVRREALDDATDLAKAVAMDSADALLSECEKALEEAQKNCWCETRLTVKMRHITGRDHTRLCMSIAALLAKLKERKK